MLSCVLLAAGASSRFGSPKALAIFGSATVIGYLQDILVQSSFDEIIIVLGSHADEIRPLILKNKKIKVVHNKDHALGQTSSFLAGLRAVASESSGAALLPVDMPWITPATIDQLNEAFLRKEPGILIPAYRQKKGHPPYFHQRLFSRLLALDASVGLNVFEHQLEKDCLLWEVDDEGTLLSFNTPQEFEEVKSRHAI